MTRGLRADPLLFVVFALIYLLAIHSFGMLRWDEAEYSTLGRSLARGEGYSIGGQPEVNRLPLLPLLIAAVLRLGLPASDPVMRSVGAICAVFTLFLVWRFVRASLGREAAVLATVLCGIAPAFWLRATYVMTDIAFAGLFAAAVWSFHEAMENDPRKMWQAAVWSALAFLMRYTAVLFFPVAVVLAVAAILRAPSRWRRLLSVHTAGGALLGLALEAPWFLHVARVSGDPWRGLRWAGNQVQAFAPGEVLPPLFYVTGMPRVLSIPTVLFLAVGIGVCIARRERFAIDCLLAAVVLIVYFSLFRWKEDRFILAAIPLLAPVATQGLRASARLLGGESEQRVAVVGALIVTILTTAIPVSQRIRGTQTRGYPAFLDAAADVRLTTRPDALVLASNTPQVAWYCERRVAPLPADQRDLRAMAAKADLVLISNFEPGQPAWANELAVPLLDRKACGTRLIADGRWATLIIPPKCL